MADGTDLLNFLKSVRDSSLRGRGEIENLFPELVGALGFDEYSSKYGIDSIADKIIVVTNENQRPLTIAFQFGFNPEVDEHGPLIPARPSQVVYPTANQILERTDCHFVICLMNTRLELVSDEVAKTIILEETDHIVESLPSYEYLKKEVATEVVETLHKGHRPPRERDSLSQSSLSEFESNS